MKAKAQYHDRYCPKCGRWVAKGSKEQDAILVGDNQMWHRSCRDDWDDAVDGSDLTDEPSDLNRSGY